jgi:hypothetical protein
MMSFLEPMSGEGLHFRYVNHVSLKGVQLNQVHQNMLILENVLEFDEE